MKNRLAFFNLILRKGFKMKDDLDIVKLSKLLEDLNVIKCHILGLSLYDKNFNKNFISEQLQAIINYLESVNK